MTKNYGSLMMQYKTCILLSYKIDYKDEPVYFDKEEKLNKDKMLGLIKKLIVRLEQINDGSFVIDDREIERIRNL